MSNEQHAIDAAIESAMQTKMEFGYKDSARVWLSRKGRKSWLSFNFDLTAKLSDKVILDGVLRECVAIV